MSIRLCAEVIIRATREAVWQRMLREQMPEAPETGSTLKPEVVTREESSRLHLRHGKMPPLLKQMDVVFSLSDHRNGTRLTTHTHFQMGRGWLVRLIYPFFRSRVEQYYVRGLNDIKADLEGLPDAALIPSDQRARMTRCP
ncbi:MAG: hypothetical protein DYG88_06375 [Chloroflexi bacterium CFX4]|nr:hypothetical protein [Chloroflexi bacterium CFX4]MDL1922765.1 hypothetical protein [Chloroflexi bacterium CFX3]